MGLAQSETCNARLVMLPGMGVDARLFEPQRRVFPNLQVPPWIEPRPRETLAGYAQRWARTLDVRPPFFLGGVSLGGIVAYLAARHLQPRAVFLVATCRSGRAISRAFRIGESISRAIPEWVLRRLRGPAANFVAWLDDCGPRHRQALHDIAIDCPIPFQRWAGHAITRWDRDGDPAEPGVPVHQIHGGQDRLIPLIPREADHVIPDGGHLINLTHADEVNRFILERIASE
jgi:pimeloyl-ACP methyl ester carboxylesterase